MNKHRQGIIDRTLLKSIECFKVPGLYCNGRQMARYRSTETNTTNSTEAVIDIFPNGQSTYGNNSLNHLGSESITKKQIQYVMQL